MIKVGANRAGCESLAPPHNLFVPQTTELFAMVFQKPSNNSSISFAF
jgi:hypothetical protein